MHHLWTLPFILGSLYTLKNSLYTNPYLIPSDYTTVHTETFLDIGTEKKNMLPQSINREEFKSKQLKLTPELFKVFDDNISSFFLLHILVLRCAKMKCLLISCVKNSLVLPNNSGGKLLG